MDKTFDDQLTNEDKAELKTQFDQYLAALRRTLEQMAADRQEIDRLKAETWEMLAQMRKAA
jgi:hypothetical protein